MMTTIMAVAQCRINRVVDVANATGLRPQEASRSREKIFSPSVVVKQVDITSATKNKNGPY